jgi:hypothetical protein
VALLLPAVGVAPVHAAAAEAGPAMRGYVTLAALQAGVKPGVDVTEPASRVY